MARIDPQTNIRLPAELKEQLAEAAKSSGRTFGAEVVWRLENSFKPSTPIEMAAARMEELADLQELRYAKNSEVDMAEANLEILRRTKPTIEKWASAEAALQRLRKERDSIAAYADRMQTEIKRLLEDAIKFTDSLEDTDIAPLTGMRQRKR